MQYFKIKFSLRERGLHFLHTWTETCQCLVTAPSTNISHISISNTQEPVCECSAHFDSLRLKPKADRRPQLAAQEQRPRTALGCEAKISWLGLVTLSGSRLWLAESGTATRSNTSILEKVCFLRAPVPERIDDAPGRKTSSRWSSIREVLALNSVSWALRLMWTSGTCRKSQKIKVETACYCFMFDS